MPTSRSVRCTASGARAGRGRRGRVFRISESLARAAPSPGGHRRSRERRRAGERQRADRTLRLALPHGRRHQPRRHRHLRHAPAPRDRRVPRRLLHPPRPGPAALAGLHPLGRRPHPVAPSDTAILGERHHEPHPRRHAGGDATRRQGDDPRIAVHRRSAVRTARADRRTGTHKRFGTGTIRGRGESGQGRQSGPAHRRSGHPANAVSAVRRVPTGAGDRRRASGGPPRTGWRRSRMPSGRFRPGAGAGGGRRGSGGLPASPGAAMRPPGRERAAMPRGSPVSGLSGGARRPVRGTPGSAPSCRPSPSGCGVEPSSAPRRRYPPSPSRRP